MGEDTSSPAETRRPRDDTQGGASPSLKRRREVMGEQFMRVGLGREEGGVAFTNFFLIT